MPLLIDGTAIPPRWSEKANARPRPVKGVGEVDSLRNAIKIAFINNMPDSALEDTELQFFELLESAAGKTAVQVKLLSLPGVPRGDRGLQHLNNFYSGTDALGDSRFDAVIMTGTEPRSRDLRDEPYWTALGGVLDWAENNTVSTVLSCLAAHAAVLHSDGIPRHALGDKQFGVFGYTRTEHPLTMGTAEIIRNPHSRWNEVREDALTACGYDVLTRSSEAGVDLFVKKKKKSLFVNFQGHPEYGAETLLKEYRRDIRRFIKRERETYPTAPQGYFGETSGRLLSEFRDKVVSSPREDLMAEFPEAALVSTLQNTWNSSATGLYRNWLQYVASKKMDRPQPVARGVKRKPALVRSEII